jgi:hypothetical protein
MKYLVFSLVATAMGAMPLAAQPPAGQHQHCCPGMMMETPWRELNGFHSILHLSHEPLMRSGDLAPARRNASLLAKAADSWAASAAPAECSAPADIGEKLAALATDVRAYAELAEKGGTDEEVKAALGKIHDQFQVTHRACMPMGRRGPHAPRPPSE